MDDNPFIRYLASKKSLDDRSLNEGVWQALTTALPPSSAKNPLKILEVGAGIGTMLQRVLERALLHDAHYTLVDADPALLIYGLGRLAVWAAEHGIELDGEGQKARLHQAGGEVTALFTAAEALTFVRSYPDTPAWDLIIAHAFLDLLDIEQAVPALLWALKPGGLLYATLNFDGLTALEPAIDLAFDDLIQERYHRRMDQRQVDGRPSGDSRTGRRLFALLRRHDAQILSAGASDWVVFPGPQGYACDEAFFLHFIIATIDRELRHDPAIDPARFQAWVQARHAQIERKELVYIAHQTDILATTG